MHNNLNNKSSKNSALSVVTRPMYHSPSQTNEQKYKQPPKNKKDLIAQKLTSLSPEERQEWVYLKRLHANQYFKAQKYDRAIQTYFEALLGVDFDQSNPQKIQQINLEYRYPLILNIVTCFFKKKQFTKSLELCRQILSEQSGKRHLKTHYKLANCLIAMGQYQQARTVINQAVKFVDQQQPQDNTSKKNITRQDFQNLLDELKTKVKDQDDMYHRIFTEKQDETEKLTQSGSAKQEEVLFYEDTYSERLAKCCEGVYRWVRSCFFDERWDKYN